MGTVVALAIGALDGDTPRRVWIGCKHDGEIYLTYNFKKLKQRIGITNVNHHLHFRQRRHCGAGPIGAGQMITIVVKASRRDDGSKAYSTRGQLFDGYVSERLVVSRSTQPLLDACRVLAREGVDPSTRVVMRHAGQEYNAMRSTVGAATKLTVSDRKGPPAFGVRQPFKGSQASGIEPTMRQSEEAGV
jgi:hypothetical protein